MAAAGQLRERLIFEARSPDADGAPLGPWAEVCTLAARVQPLRASDPVVAARLQGLQPVTITVRCSTLTSLITTACRARDLRTGAIYDPIAGVQPDERLAWIEILATWKVGQSDG